MLSTEFVKLSTKKCLKSVENVDNFEEFNNIYTQFPQSYPQNLTSYKQFDNLLLLNDVWTCTIIAVIFNA